MGSLSPIRFRNTRVVDNDSDDATSPVDSPDMVNTPMSSSRRSNTDGNVRSPTIVTGRDSFMEMSDFDDRGMYWQCIYAEYLLIIPHRLKTNVIYAVSYGESNP